MLQGEGKGHGLNRAFVIGNVALDEVFHVADLPRAGESVHGVAQHTGLGGKGANQAIALSRTGVPTFLTAVLGTDGHAQRIRAELAVEPVSAKLIERRDLATDRSLIFAQPHGDNIIVTTNACATSVTGADALRAVADATAGDMVLAQGNLSLDATCALARHCRDVGLTFVLNPSPFDPAFRVLLPLTDVLFVNETEAQGLTGHVGQAALPALLAAGAGTVVMTRGAEGALLAKNGGVTRVPALPARVVDVTGAGDCFEGVAIGSALLRACDIDELALRHATEAAAIAIGRPGTVRAFPTAEQLAAILAQR